VSQIADELASPEVIGGIAPTSLRRTGDFETDRRAELRAFLMSRRARLRPSDVGLPETGRRRTPGLRREEVAQLAGLSTEWYTLLEMAKDLRVSDRTIHGVARALKLSAAETSHLQNLITGELPAAAPTATGADIDASLLAVLDGYQTGPAMLLNARMDVIAENAQARAVFGDLARAEGDEKNWLWYLYTNHHLIGEWESQARQVTATFRGVFCEHATDTRYSGLVERLLTTSEPFRRLWNEHDVSRLDDSLPLTLLHPVYGTLRFTIRVLAQPGTAATYCCFLVPDETTTLLLRK